jgi:hypothetical protein
MSDTKKGATIFDFINGLTHKKKKWSEWSEVDQKKFSPYMINRWLSMRIELVDFINELQQYTIGQLRPSETYRLYHDFLPESKAFAKYIKGKSDNKYDKQLISQIAEHYQIGKTESTEYIELLDWDSCNFLLSKYGYSEKQRKTMLKGVKKK